MLRAHCCSRTKEDLKLSRGLALPPDHSRRGMVADGAWTDAVAMPEVTRCKHIRQGCRCEESGCGEQSGRR
jgi:hypothetical protein